MTVNDKRVGLGGELYIKLKLHHLLLYDSDRRFSQELI